MKNWIYMNLLAVSMTKSEITGLVVAILGLLIFSVVFTIIYYFLTKRDRKDINEGKRDIELIDDDLRSSTEKNVKRRKRLNILGNVLFYLLIALLVPLIIFSIVSRVQGDYFMIGNKGIIAVGSGSMSYKNNFNGNLYNNELRQQYNLDNQFDTYAVIQIEKVNEASDLNLYDVIAFVNNEGTQVIHRIVEIYEENGVTKYRTWGDANASPDTYRVEFKDIIGRYTSKKVNGIGIIVLFLNNAIGLLTIVALIYILLMIDFFRKRTNAAKKERLQLLSIIFNPEKNNTVLSGNLYYKECKYVYNQNRFIRKESIAMGSMRKRSLENPIYQYAKDGQVIEEDIEIDYFDPIYQDGLELATNANEKIKPEHLNEDVSNNIEETIKAGDFDSILQEEDGQEDV